MSVPFFSWVVLGGLVVGGVLAFMAIKFGGPPSEDESARVRAAIRARLVAEGCPPEKINDRVALEYVMWLSLRRGSAF